MLVVDPEQVSRDRALLPPRSFHTALSLQASGGNADDIAGSSPGRSCLGRRHTNAGGAITRCAGVPRSLCQPSAPLGRRVRGRKEQGPRVVNSSVVLTVDVLGHAGRIDREEGPAVDGRTAVGAFVGDVAVAAEPGPGGGSDADVRCGRGSLVERPVSGEGRDEDKCAHARAGRCLDGWTRS
jgi:hypothetical protein